ncbi:MAG: membrane integrity-associated transporter subunit PqiC [Arcobacteraceae bacterium]|nr:membrane integrity-associated transporter subunit PqiC [Arcobacteraceae bacterium]
MHNKTIQKISIVWMMLLFTGCNSVNLPALKIFQLESSKDCCKIKENKQNLTIKILEPVTNKYLNTTTIYYSKDKYLLQTYKLSKWSDYPVKMILEVLSSKLDELNIYDNIITSHIYSKPDYTLQSELIDFKQYINSKSYVTLKIKFYLIKDDQGKKVISKIFSYKVPCNSINAYGGVEAFNKSIDLLINDLSFWLYDNTKEQ